MAKTKLFPIEGKHEKSSDLFFWDDVLKDEGPESIGEFGKELEEAARMLTHSSKLADSEPSWGDVDKTPLPDNAFADDTRSFPHHWVKGGKIEDDRFVSGEMYLHRGGLGVAWGAARGARTGKQASDAVKAHLRKHREAVGVEESDTLADVVQSFLDSLQGVVLQTVSQGVRDRFHVETVEVEPHKGEKEDDFIGRCIPLMVDEGMEQDQAIAVCYDAWRDRGKKKAKKVGEARYRRDKCMNCDEPPTIEVRWAEGMAHAWFCDPCYGEWENKDEVNTEKKIEYGVARKKFSDRTSPKTVEEVEEPKPQEGEDKDTFLARCIPFILERNGTGLRREAIIESYELWDVGQEVR